MAGVIINPEVTTGKNVIINSGAIVEHNCIIKDHVHICPGVNCAGCVEIGEYSHIGIGSTIKQGVKIGRNVTVGAGSVVIKDIPENVVAVGVPAEIIREKDIVEKHTCL
jgi:UDP-perosamine 4-acetyltransferase